MATRNQPSFARMCRACPVRTALFTLGPLAIGLAQLFNAFVHDVAVWPVALVAAVSCAFSVLVTSYHLSAFRRRRLTASLE